MLVPAVVVYEQPTLHVSLYDEEEIIDDDVLSGMLHASFLASH